MQFPVFRQRDLGAKEEWNGKNAGALAPLWEERSSRANLWRCSSAPPAICAPWVLGLTFPVTALENAVQEVSPGLLV